MMTYYALHVTKDQFAGTLRLNDVPLSHWHDAKPAGSAHAVNMWITGRSNRVSVVFENRPVLSPKVEITVRATTRPDQPSDEGVIVASFHWPADPLSPGRPPEVGFSFDAADPPPSALWPALKPLDLDESVRAGVTAALMELQGALARREIGRVAAILDFKALDVGRAMYLVPDRARTSQHDFLEMFLSEPGWTMAPLAPTDIELQLVADRRLVWASRPDGTPILQSSARKSPQLMLPVYLALLNGRWTVVR